MRVTNSMMITNMLSNLNRNLNSMSRKQDELATGKKVINASDDPVAAAKILKFKTDLSDMAQYSTNARDAQAWLDATESTIAEMGTVLQRVRELSVQAANGTNTAEDTKKIKEEIVQLRDHLVSSGNFNFAGRYLFSSHYTDKPLLTKEGRYNIPITAEDLINKPVAVYEVSAKEYMPVGTHGIEIFGTVLEENEFQNKMPDAKSVDGIAAQKSAIMVDFSLTQNYAVGANMEVTVNGTTYQVNKALLEGAPLDPLGMQEVLTAFREGTDGSAKLSDVADVYFDSNKKLVIRNKTLGTLGVLQMSSFAGVSNPKNITDPAAPVSMGAVSDPVTGIDSVKATVTSGQIFNSADVADFKGKEFVMTFNGFTKTITIPDNASITSDTALKSAIQAEVDEAFGSGNVTVNLSDGAPISFETVTGTNSSRVPELRIQPVKVTESELIVDMNHFIEQLVTGDTNGIGETIGKIDKHLNQLLAVRADLGARVTRVELIDARINENNITFTRLLSDSQDADMSQVIMHLKNSENVYKAALSVGGKIIQPSLVDFIR